MEQIREQIIAIGLHSSASIKKVGLGSLGGEYSSALTTENFIWVNASTTALHARFTTWEKQLLDNLRLLDI